MRSRNFFQFAASSAPNRERPVRPLSHRLAAHERNGEPRDSRAKENPIAPFRRSGRRIAECKGAGGAPALYTVGLAEEGLTALTPARQCFSRFADLLEADARTAFAARWASSARAGERPVLSRLKAAKMPPAQIAEAQRFGERVEAEVRPPRRKPEIEFLELE